MKLILKLNKMDVKRITERGQFKVKISNMLLEEIKKQMDEIKRNDKIKRAIFGPKVRKRPYIHHLKMPIEPNGDVRGWCCKKVGSFVDKIVTLNSTYRSPDEAVSYSGHFIKRAIEGNMFLNLSLNDLTGPMKIPLGSAIKIFNGMLNLRRNVPELDENLMDELYQ